MAIQITKNKEIFEIEGSIVAENVRSLQDHFEKLLSKTDKIILCVDKVSKIDSSGVVVLTKLFKTAMKKNKIFYVIGKENEKVKTAFGHVNYILKSDFV